ncbi:MAG: LysE family translocator [Actinobacteria bacterium]|nr:LysE family translocator [Actinomycetota bacterium]
MNLEQRYRRLVRLYPREWRRRHGDSLVATLLDAASPARRHPSMPETLDLVRGACRAHRAAASLGMARTAVAVLATAAMVVAAGVPPEFVVTSVVVSLLPGTGVFYTVSSAIGGGWNRGLWASIGCTFGIVPHVLAAMLGLSGVMQIGATVFDVIRWAGVIYLVTMGVAMMRAPADALVRGTDSAVGQAAVARRAVVLNLLNPKLTVFFFAFLPQFVDPSPGLVDRHLLALALVFMLITLVVFLGYAAAAAALRQRVLEAPAVRRFVQRTLGGLLVAFGIKLAADH